MKRNGVTLVEVLVSIGVIGALLALLVPAIQMARESARHVQCRANLQQIGLALQNYESQHSMLPACGVKQVSWHVSILPFIDMSSVYARVDYSAAEPANAVQGVRIAVYLCPSESAPDVFQNEIKVAATNYLGNSGTGLAAGGYDGLFQHFIPAFPGSPGPSGYLGFPEGPVRTADITDGLSNTSAVSEVLHSIGGAPKDRLRVVWNTPRSYTVAELDEFRDDCAAIPIHPVNVGWLGSPLAHGWRWAFGEIGFSTYNHMQTPMQPSCFNGTAVQDGIYSAASNHGAIVNVLYADGHIQSTSAAVDRSIWASVGSRNGSESTLP